MELRPLEEFKPCDVCYNFFSFNKGELKGLDGIVYEERVLDKWIAHRKMCKIYNPGLKRQGNGAHQGAWAFTLTKSPTDPFSVGDMLTAVRKVMSQKSCPVERYAWYYEDKGRDINGDAIHPHIHGMYETTTQGRIEAKHWKRAWSIWNEKAPMGAGFRGGYHRPVKHGEAYEDYIKKDGGMSEKWSMHTLIREVETEEMPT